MFSFNDFLGLLLGIGTNTSWCVLTPVRLFSARAINCQAVAIEAKKNKIIVAVIHIHNTLWLSDFFRCCRRRRLQSRGRLVNAIYRNIVRLLAPDLITKVKLIRRAQICSSRKKNQHTEFEQLPERKERKRKRVRRRETAKRKEPIICVWCSYRLIFLAIKTILFNYLYLNKLAYTHTHMCTSKIMDEMRMKCGACKAMTGG